MGRSLVLVFLSVFVAAAGAQGQQREIYLGPGSVSALPQTQPENFLAKCLANPDDKISCLAADTKPGLENAAITSSTYVTCNRKGGVCLEVVTFDLRARPKPAEPQQRLASIDVSILFDFDAATVRASETDKLKQLAGALKDLRNKDATFAVIGHTDAKGTEAYNCRLSAQRALAVSTKLAGLGVPSTKLISLGAGEYLLRNEDNGEAADNRRVGFAKMSASGADVVQRLRKLCRASS